MTAETISVTCRGCEATGDSPPTATAWRCPGCDVLWAFLPCRTCSRVSWVREENARGWTCPHCGKDNVTVDMAAARQEFHRVTDKNLKILYVGLAVIVIGVLLTLMH